LVGQRLLLLRQGKETVRMWFRGRRRPGHGSGVVKGVLTADSARTGGGGHKVALLMECKEKDPKRRAMRTA